MSISYSQNLEDIILNRVFKDTSVGRYVDIGAGHPTVDSVTRLFYDQGWRGINVEPNPTLYNDLLRERPRDININCGVADVDSSETLDFLCVPLSGLSTFDQSLWAGYLDEFPESHVTRVEVNSLASIAANNRDFCKEVEFLKIDVEGYEKEALSGADFDLLKPKVVIVESTKPRETTPSFVEWEQHLLSNDYKYVYFDGLNRFYVRKDHPHLEEGFSSPPNVFDNYERYGYVSAIQELEKQSLENQKLFDENQNLRQSFSWRLTRPLRFIAKLLKLTIKPK